MNYGLRYRLPFVTRKGRRMEVRVEKRDYAGEVAELTGQASPFVVKGGSDDGEKVYAPSRLSTAELNVFGGDYLSDLFATDPRETRVTLYEDGVPAWCGYVKPEVYTQDYRHARFPLTVECVGALSVLEHVDYRQKGAKRGMVSLWELVGRCLEESGGLWTRLVLPHTFAATEADYDAWDNPLRRMTIAEQNFFDEDDEAMTLLEVLEELMKLLGWTVCDLTGEVVVVDADNEGAHYCYPLPLTDEYVKEATSVRSVQAMGYGGSDHTYDLTGGFNKVTVKCSNYPVGDLIPAINFVTDVKKVAGPGFVSELTGDSGAENGLTRYFTHFIFYSTEKWTLRAFDSKGGYYGPLPDTFGKLNREVLGAVLCKTCNYYTKKGWNDGTLPEASITDYNWEPAIHLRLTTYDGDTKLKNPFVNPVNVLTIESPYAFFRDSALVIGGSLSYCNMQMCLQEPGGEEVDQYLMCSLRIGNFAYQPDEILAKDEHGSWWDKNGNPIFATDKAQKGWHETAGAPPVFPIRVERAKIFEYAQVKNTHRMDDGYTGANGYVIPIPEGGLAGAVEFSLYGMPAKNYGQGDEWGYLVKNLSVSIHKKEFSGTAETDEGSDRTYTNVVNEAYLHEMDAIELKMSTYNDDGACYGKVLLDGAYLTDNLYCMPARKAVRLEEFLIRRVVNRYSAPKVKLTLELQRGRLRPCDVVTDLHQPGKRFLPVAVETDYRADVQTVTLMEQPD